MKKEKYIVNKNKLKRAYFSLSIFSLFIFSYFVYLFVHFYYFKGHESSEVWSATQELTLDYTIQLQKDPNKDFVVLNLADVQMTDGDLINGKYLNAKKIMKQLITETKPDLITLTGDNFAGPKNNIVVKDLVNYLDSFHIYWAPVMGNHDNDGSGDYNWLTDYMLNQEYCVFRKGPKEMGVGNYVITIMENTNIAQALIMMDSHDDEIYDNQQDWYSWVVEGLNNVAGYNVYSTLMFHIPLYEYDEAWDYWVANDYNPVIGSGEKNETICCSNTSNGFFDLIKTLGSTKNIVCGHDHMNSFSIFYEGVRLTYAIKSSHGSYYDNSLIGGTVLSISSSDLNIVQYLL